MNRRAFLEFLGAWFLMAAVPSAVTPVVSGLFQTSGQHVKNASSLESLIEKMKNPKIICYSPTNYNPDWGIYPSQESIRSDISLLVSYGFTGIITYGCNRTLTSIPLIAKEYGMQLVITGVWDPKDSTEVNNAISTAQNSDAFCIGNEQLNVLYTGEQLTSAVNNVRTQTSKPVTTTQQVDWYGDNSLVQQLSDFLLPTGHPWWSNIREPQASVDFIVSKYDEMVGKAGGKFILMKESGFPTGGNSDATEQNQKQFFELLLAQLQNQRIYSAWFEAFDQPWKTYQPVEPYWGIFKANRTTKLYTASIAPTPTPTPTPNPTPTSSPTPTPTSSPTPTFTSTPTGTYTPTPTYTQQPSPYPTSISLPSPTPIPTSVPGTSSPSPLPTPILDPTTIPAPASSPTPVFSPTPTPTATPLQNKIYIPFLSKG